jgi:thymidylate synthase (methanogen type)
MKEIKTNTIGEAWISSCKYIFEKGESMKDDDKKLKEVLFLQLTIKKPSQKDEIIEKYGDKAGIAWMDSNFTEQKNVPELKNALSYGTRLFNYKGKNQVEWVIEKLKKKPETKAATISMIMQDDENYIPCVSLLDFKIRDNKLMLTAMCRAIDFGKKVYANLLSLNKIQEMVAKEIGVKVGDLVMYNVSAHIYEEDYDKIKKTLGVMENA